MHHFTSFGSEPSQDPSKPAWWGDRLAFFPNGASAVASAYSLYAEAFRKIRETSVIRAHMDRDEFVHVVQSSSTYNIGVFDEGQLVGLCSLDTDVATNGALNPQALQNLYPDQYARTAVYYCWFMATQESSRGAAGVLSHMLEGIGELVTERRGCVVFDVIASRGNLTPEKHARALKVFGSQFATTSIDTLDTEHYFAIQISPKVDAAIDLRDAQESPASSPVV